MSEPRKAGNTKDETYVGRDRRRVRHKHTACVLGARHRLGVHGQQRGGRVTDVAQRERTPVTGPVGREGLVLEEGGHGLHSEVANLRSREEVEDERSLAIAEAESNG